MNRLSKTWMIALGGLGALLAPSKAAPGADAPAPPPAPPPPQETPEPDLTLLRHHLRRAQADRKVPQEICEALERLVQKDEKRAHAWKAVRSLIEAAATEAEHADERRMLSRMAITPGKRDTENLAQWQVRVRALMALVREDRLAEDVYQQARQGLEEELRKALSEQAVDGVKPYPKTVDEAVRLVLQLVEPDLKDPKTLPSPLREGVAKLISQLGDPDWKVRSAASERLRDIGEPALGALRQALYDKDPEVAERARKLWDLILDAEDAKP